jgi:hypothetical protein
MNKRARRTLKLKRRPLLVKHAAAAARRQRLNPREPQPASFTEAITGRLTAGPAERRDKQIKRCAKH